MKGVSCRCIVRNEGDLEEGDGAHLVAIELKDEGNGGGIISGGETAAKRARGLEENDKYVRAVSFCTSYEGCMMLAPVLSRFYSHEVLCSLAVLEVEVLSP